MNTVSARQLAWLEGELAAWQADSLVTDGAARAIRARYTVSNRLSLARLLLALGACFVVAGLVWLVAANLDQISPAVRFGGVVLLWLGLMVAAELVAERRARGESHPGDAGRSPVVGALQLLAAGAFGAVIFQAAQSLQVPAYTPSLVGVWALGALLHAYTVDGIAPLLVGIATGTVWFVWESASVGSVLGFVTALLLGSVVATAAGTLHAARWRPRFSTPWRLVGALLALVGVFVAALPIGDDDPTWSVVLTAGAVGAALLAGAALVLGGPSRRIEVAVPVLATVTGVVLVLWDPGDSVDDLGPGQTARALVSVLVYLVLAGWYAVLGVRGGLPGVTALATAALVLFTTVQSFAVFAPIISGAALFLAVGVVLLASGYGFDRARRRIVAGAEGGPA